MTPLTEFEMACLRAYAEHGSQAAAATALGRPLQTVKNTIHIAYIRLGVNNAIGAFRVLGWLRLP